MIRSDRSEKASLHRGYVMGFARVLWGAILWSSGAFAQLSGGPYSLRPFDVNCGGTTSTGGPYSLSASTGQAGGVGTITAEPVPAPPLYQFDDGFWSTISITAPPPIIIWNPDPSSVGRDTRTLTISLTPATATGGSGSAALQIMMVDLQHPVPHNRPQYPPPNFTAFDTATNGGCSGATTGPNFNGHHCDTDTDCLGPNNAIATDDGTCGSLLACTAAGEANSCARWVGPVATFREKQDVLSLGTYRAARLQCTPYYTDWTTLGQFSIFGAELLPSSYYDGVTFGSSCKGMEATCTNVSPPVTMFTRRSGDTAATWNPPGTTDQPDGADVVAVLNKFKGLVGSPSNATVLLQPNSIDPNADVSGSDIVATVDAFKGLAYPFSGPCTCPSTVTCNVLACPPGDCGAGVCVKTCQGGTNDGLPCGDNTHDHCPGGTCPATGFCRDRCGRCN